MIRDAPFRAFPQFNRPERRPAARLRHRVGVLPMDWFDRPAPPDRIARALADRRAIDLKELLEAFEFHARVRRRVRAPVVADLCCGHGLVGLLFATDPAVQQVILLDRRAPGARERVVDAVAEVFPSIRDKVRHVEAPVEGAARHLPAGCGVVAVHACGVRTDRCLDAALVARCAAVAAMPCCYARTGRGAPPVLREALGHEVMTDVHRTYRLHRAGYRVDWSAIPRAITPMNRILVATRG